MSKYSTEFKLQVVKYYKENHCGYNSTAKYFNVGYSCVQRWIKYSKRFNCRSTTITNGKLFR